MTANLTTLISKIQALLGDDGTRFSTETVTAAVREALKDFNQAAPRHKQETATVVPGQREYLLDTAEFAGLLKIHSVHKVGVTSALPGGVNGPDIPLAYDPYWSDNEPGIRLHKPLRSGDLLVGFSIPNTVDGLDGADESTLPDYYDQILADGGAYHALIIRATGRTETINLNRDVIEQYLSQAAAYKVAFEAGLALAALRRAPASTRDNHTWMLDTHRDY